jgi:putative oxidoreductase
MAGPFAFPGGTMHFLAPYVEPIYAIFRVVTGLLFASHGAQKILGVFGGQRIGPDAGLFYAAGWIELVGGLMIALGLLTPIVAFLCSGEMAVAYFKGHVSQGGFWPWENQGELAAVYCFVFLYIAARGGGRYSLDAMRGVRRALR